jgi:hypothetical protein
MRSGLPHRKRFEILVLKVRAPDSKRYGIRYCILSQTIFVSSITILVIKTLDLDPDPHRPNCWIQIRIWIAIVTNADSIRNTDYNIN